jgi:ATP-dependent helicase/nuclease subunit A
VSGAPGASGAPVPYRAQVVASTPDASAWVSASAGSGKTKVLADRVLRLLLDGAAPGRILCLTFTRAAAAEMQNRVRRLLGEWAVMPDEKLVAAITGLTDRSPDAATRAVARRLFAEVLEAPGGLKIQTIHSFCESLLGRFPLEAGIPPHFEVMDDRTSAEALEAARDDILALARDGSDPALADALEIVTGWINEDEFSDLMAEIAGSRGRLRRLIEGHGGHLEAAAATREALRVAADETVEAVIRDACAEGAFDREALRNAAEAMTQGGKRDGERAALILAWLEKDFDNRVAGFETYTHGYLSGEGTVFANFPTKPVREAAPDAEGALHAEAARLIALAERCKAIQTAEATAAILEIATALIDRYEAYKHAHALLDYDDLILKARALVEEAAPWVLFKLDGGIDHVLIDEAQDSNADQWAVVRAIADEFFAGEGARDVARTIFAVGDEKQSIFSFQGAAPDQFAAMQDHFRNRVLAAERTWEPVQLDVSFRSTTSVLQAVDAVFADEAVRAGVSGVRVRHTAHRRGQGGRVEVWPPVLPEKREAPSPWTNPDELGGEETPAARLAQAIAGRIESWLASGEMLESAGRPVRPGDIMVLVRRRTDFVDALIRELKRRRIEVAGLDRMVLTDQLAVRDLIALGDFALMPQDDLNLAAILKGPLFGFDEEALFSVCNGRDGTVWQSLRVRAGTDEQCADAVARLSEILARADMTPPYEFFAHILGPMLGRARILARLREEANDPIDEFLALALAFETAHPPSLQGFLRWLAEGQAEIKRDLDQGVRDEVRIMTVHGAKGLQAPIVFLADTMQTPQPARGLLWDDGSDRDAPDLLLWPPRSRTREEVAGRLYARERARQDEEYRRLLYVAMTRAEDRLYVAGYGTRNAAPAGSWHNLVRDGLGAVADIFDFDAGGFATADPWSGEGLVLSNPHTFAGEQAAGSEPADAAVLPLPDWSRIPAPEEPEPSRPLAPSRPVSAEPATRSPLGEDGGAGFRRGLLVHRLLQTLPDLPAARREASARAFLARPVHELAADEIDALVAETFGVLDHPECAALFGPGSRAEVPVAGVVGGTAISGRIDRLLVTPETVRLLDFKTNRPPPVRVEDVPAIYLRQMAAYRALLSEIYENQRVECALLWTDGPRLMSLDAQVLDAHAP